MKRLAVFFLMCLTFAGLVGCSRKQGNKMGFMPKLAGIPYFNACKRGAEEAARELGIDLVYDGPTKADVGQQIDLLNQWTASGDYNCITVACNDPDQIADALKKARRKGIFVVTYDADANDDARQFFVNQATYDAVAEAMIKTMAEELEPKGTGQVALLTSYRSAPNQSQWASRIKAYAKKHYPDMELLGETEHGEDRDKGIAEAKHLIEANPRLKGIIGLTSVAVPAAAEAVRQKGKKGKIKVTGVSTPKDMRDYLKDGTVQTVILWNPIDLGYLTVYVADLVRKGRMPEDGTIRAGRLGNIKVHDREVLLGKPLFFTEKNIDQYDF
jgi:rhamnose transport system substrate-binding protein